MYEINSLLHRTAITVAIMMATLMQTLDGTIANVALPHMQGSLSASQNEVIWVLTSYMVAAAIATPLTGWLSSRLGISRLFCVGITGFTISSIACGLSMNLGELIGARLLQGIFGACLVPLSQTVLLGINTKEKHGRAMAIWGIGVMIGPIIGPTLGGWLTESYSWRWVFFVNVPIGIAALAGVLSFLPKEEQPASTNFDFFGFTTLAISIGALQLLLDRGEQLDWLSSIEIRVEVAAALISFSAFVIHTWFSGEESFFKTELLFDRNFVIGISFIFLIGAILYATRALLPAMLQNLMNYDALSAGIVTAPSALGTMIAMLVVGRLVGRVNTIILLFTGLLISAFASYQMMGYTLEISKSDIVWPGVIQGFGLGFIFVPLSAETFSTLAPKLRTDAAGIYNLIRNVGSSIGVSCGQSLLTRNTQISHASLVEHINISNPALHSVFNTKSSASAAYLNSLITQQASMIAYLDLFKLMFVTTLCVIPFLIFLRKPPKKLAAKNSIVILE